MAYTTKFHALTKKWFKIIAYCLVLAIIATAQIGLQDGEVNVGPFECFCHPHDGKGGRIAYLITLHNNRTLDDAQVLLKSIVAPGNIVIIHIDKKLPWTTYLASPLRSLIESCNCGSEIFVDSIYDCVWGSWSMLDPLHWGK
jgi:hypothetical protein